MKLRIHKNSIRLRLSQPEVDKIGKGQGITETLETGLGWKNDFSYCLMPMEYYQDIGAEFEQNTLKIYLSKNQAEAWAYSDSVGITHVTGDRITILIEKDFQCLHKRPGEDESQNFSHPLADEQSTK
jgi:hypothetical protein